MKYKFIDTHAHLTSNELYLNMDPIMERAKEAGVSSVVNICTDRMTLERGILAKNRYREIFNAGATTPHDAEKLGERDFPYFERAAQEGHLVAIGETGLDYYYKELNRDLQQQLFIRYLALAKELNLPVIIHCRDAFCDLFSILDREYNQSSVLLHCFTGTLDEAKEAINRGFMISISGILTFKKSEELRSVAKEIPLQNLVIETDSPYLAPQSRRGQQNEPAFALETLEALAEIKGLNPLDFSHILFQNTVKFFKLSQWQTT